MRTTWIFDPRAERWARAGDLGTPMAFHASVVVDGSLYAIGGNVERFDAATGTWNVAMGGEPFAQSHLTAAVSGSKILLAGGFPDSRPRLAIVDAAAKSWKPVPEYPGFAPQDHFVYLAAFDGVFHVAGGFSGTDFQPTTRHWAWDGRAWRPRAAIPVADATKFASWAADPERRALIMFGMNGNFEYDARSDSWSALPAPPWSGFRAMPACFSKDGYLYVLGGMGDGREFGVDVFDSLARRWVP